LVTDLLTQAKRKRTGPRHHYQQDNFIYTAVQIRQLLKLVSV
jgi:hypothetical protein